MESVKKAKSRLKQYPVMLGKCSTEAMAYANCVLKKDSPSFNDCTDDFKRFKDCLRKSASELKIRF